MGFDRWKLEVRGLVELLDQDGPHDPDRYLARNRLAWTRTTDGVTHLKGQLVGEHGVLFDQAVATKADELARRFAADHALTPEIAVPPRATLQALALLELIRQGLATDLANAKPPRTEVALRIRADDVTDVTTPEGERMRARALDTLLCDPDVFAIVMSGLGVPLDLGRRARFANDYQRRALIERDGGCTFPGCDAPPRWTDVHHIDHWEHGGHTKVARMALDCRHHHGVTHRPGWRMDITEDGWCYWTTPEGQTFWGQRHGRQHPGPDPPPSPP